MKKFAIGTIWLFALMTTAGTVCFASDITITGMLSNGVYHAEGKITSVNTCEVESTKHVYFLASTKVGLNPGFRVKSGGKLNIIIGNQNDLPAGLDADNDQMPDAWEIQNGIDTTQDNSGQDADGDGASNLVEYKSGTNPSNGNNKPGGVYYEYNPDGRIKRITKFN
jgi:hypothetical protein